MTDYQKLQNGSDIRGTAIALPGGKPIDLTEESTRAIAFAFARWLANKTGTPRPRVAVGRDSRLSGEALGGWFLAALAEAGVWAADCGLATTPAMFMSTVTEGYAFDGAVMITASHLPMERNGFKFFTREGGLEKPDITAILSLASQGRFDKKPGGQVGAVDFMPVYANGLCAAIRQGTGKERPLAGLRVIVDAGNGAGGFFERDVLRPLGADTEGSLCLEPDGRFPNHAPNPEDETAMAHITHAVLAGHGDLGILFDTDVDRAGAVLPDGRELNRNRLIAMLAAIELREYPGGAIVTDSITSTGLAEFIQARGGVHRRFKRGYRNVINEAVRLNAAGINCPMAMETSGHGALRENYFLDDGAYLMVKLLIELANAKSRGDTLFSLIAGLREPAESAEFRMALTLGDFAPYGKNVITQVEAWAKAQPGFTLAADNFEGVRGNADEGHGSGWFLLRMSLHEPLMPLNIESDVPGGVTVIAKALVPFLRQFDQLDLSALLKAAQ